MSIRMMAQVWNSAMPTPTHKLVLLAFADYANGDNICWPSLATIAAKSGVSRRQVQRIVADLLRGGLIDKVNLLVPPHRTPTYLIRGDRMTPLEVNDAAHVASGTPDEQGRDAAHVASGTPPTSPKPSVNHHNEPSGEPAEAATGAGEGRGIIFELYEQTIGTIDPHIASVLADAEREFPEECLRHSFVEASTHNVRRWKYVEAVLRRHKTEGCYERHATRERRSGRGGRRAAADGPDIDAWRQYAAGSR